MKKFLFLATLLLLLLVGAACAEEYTVGEGGDYATLTQALSEATDGDTLRLLPGPHLEEEGNYPIVIGRSVAIIGEEGATLTGVPFQSILEITAKDVRIENVRFDLLRYGIKNLADGLTVDGCEFVLADETYRVSSCGIWLAGAYNCTVTNCSFTGCGMCVAGPPLRSAAVPCPCSPACSRSARTRRCSRRIPSRATPSTAAPTTSTSRKRRGRACRRRRCADRLLRWRAL